MEYPKVVLIQAVAMANGEFIHYGNSLGFMSRKQIKLLESGTCKISRGNEAVVEIAVVEIKNNKHNA